MQRLKNYRVVIHIKNHNLCSTLILFFLLGINISHIYNEESNVYLKFAATRGRARRAPPSDTKERPGALPPLPRAGGINHG